MLYNSQRRSLSSRVSSTPCLLVSFKKNKTPKHNIAYQLAAVYTATYIDSSVLPCLFGNAFLQSFKNTSPPFHGHCWPFKMSTVEFIMISSPGPVFLWTNLWRNSSEPSRQPTATCKSTHLIRLPISANYSAAYRRHLATIINALVRVIL